MHESLKLLVLLFPIQVDSQFREGELGISSMGKLGLFLFALYLSGFLLHLVFLQDANLSLNDLSSLWTSLVWPVIDYLRGEWHNFIIPFIAGFTTVYYDKFIVPQNKR